MVQLYVRDVEASVRRPEKELKRFAKVVVEPGATARVHFTLDDRAFAFWDQAAADWRVEPGEFELLVGPSSADIRARAIYVRPSVMMTTFERHPWNDSFEWSFTAGEQQVFTPEQAEQFDTEGYVVLEDVFDADEVADVVAELDETDARVEQFLRTQDGERMKIAEAGAITFTPHAVTRSDRVAALRQAPGPRGAVRRHHRARRQPLLGPGRVQEAREAPALSRGIRTTATRSSSRSST